MKALQHLKQKNLPSVFDEEVIKLEDLREATTYRYDIVGAEVGDSKETVFYPQVKMKKWDNECNFSLRFNYPIAGSVEQVSNTIYWKSADKKVEAVFYDIAPCRNIYYVFGGFEFEVIFNEKPISNKVEFSIQSKNLDFYKQQKLDDPMTNCADMIIGSYAIYHSSKKNNKYTTGKAFQIYRSFVYDSNGRQEYCDMNIDADILTITIPQDFIDNAVYPITLDPTIGKTDIGAYLQIFTHDSAIAVSSGTPSGVNPKAVSISAFACWQTLGTRWDRDQGLPYGSDYEYNPRGLKMCLWEKATGKFIVQSFSEDDGVVDLDGSPYNYFPFYIYNLPGKTGSGGHGALGYDNDPTESSEEYPSNKAEFSYSDSNRPYEGDYGFDRPQRWLTQLLTPNDTTKRSKFHNPWGEPTTTRYVSQQVIDSDITTGVETGEKVLIASEHNSDDEYYQQYMSSTPTPIDNIEYYIGVVFNYENDVTGYSDGLDNPYCTGTRFCANLFIRRNSGIDRQLCRFDLVPGGGNGCETGEHPWWPSFADLGPTFRMFAFPYDLQRIPLGSTEIYPDGQWEDRNYSVYLNYTSSSSSSVSSSTTSSSSSSSHAYITRTFGENTSDDNNNVVLDTYLREDHTTRNYGISAQLELTGQGIGADENVLIKFDLSSLPGGTNIISAKLYVKTVKIGQGVDKRDFISAYKMLVPWQEGDMDNAIPSGSGSTWSHKVYSTATLWNTAGANGSGIDHEAIEADTVYFVFADLNTQSKWYSFDVTIEVGEQIAGSNYGFILTGSGSGIGGSIPIYSSNGEDGNRPYLEVSYN